MDTEKMEQEKIEESQKEMAEEQEEISKREIPQLSDEELDNVADTAIDYIQSIVSHFNLGEITINEYEGADKELILDINGDDLAILIGKHGTTLDSIQHVVGVLSYKKQGFYYPVVIDVEGYKSRQRIKLENLAKNLANRVARSKKPYSMHPMNPYKRRIVHTYLSGDDRVDTHSEGEGRNRHLVISPK